MTRHTSTPPRDRFIRTRRARFTGDYCHTCRDDASKHRTVPSDTDNPTHCWTCCCEVCGEW